MGKRLEGKVAVVTGGGNGIGRGICLALASEGASVVVNNRVRDKSVTPSADLVVEEIIKAGGKAVANYDSVGSMADGKSIVKTAIDNYGKIDILVNNAGNYVSTLPLEMTEEVWDATITTHLKGHFACTQAAIAEMVKNKSGRIITTSSRGSFFGKAGMLAYATAKAGIMGFTSQLAQYLEPENITVNCILPSANTNLFPNKKSDIGDHMPLPNPAHPDYIAPIVVYLCTDEAKDLTGQFVYAGGGDICFYDHPLLMTSGHRFVRKTGMWTLEELEEVIPSITGRN